MDAVQLKQNKAKTELVYFGNQKQIFKCTAMPLDVKDVKILRSDIIQYLGAWLDTSLTMNDHIKGKRCNNHVKLLENKKNIIPLFTKDTCQLLIIELYFSHMDYINLILFGFPDPQINKFQHIQNMCGKLILNWGKFDNTSKALRTLHWLLVKSRIVFKLLLISSKCINSQAPEYLKSILVRPPRGMY